VQEGNREEINKNLFRRRLSRDNDPLEALEPDFSDSQGVIKLIKRALENQEKCNIKGKIQLPRVSTAIVRNIRIGHWTAPVQLQQ
jgi:hypothetical protein